MRCLFAILLLVAGTSGAIAQQWSDTTRRAWFIPDYAKVQYAGAIGLVSGGAGYIHGRRKMETELMVGYLPASVGGDHLISMTGKWNYLPWEIDLGNERLSLIPLQTGAYLSYTFGSQFHTFLPDRYPRGYYWWSSSLRFGMFAGSRLRHQSVSGRNVDFYYEIGTYDLKFISWFQNVSSLSFIDIINISAGVKIEF